MRKLSFALALAMALFIVTVTACSNPLNLPDPPPEPQNVPTKPSDPPSFTVKAEIKADDGSTLQFSEKPVRVQWGIGDSPLDIAFVFPLHTRIVQRMNGQLVRIYVASEYQAVNRIYPKKNYGNSVYELMLTAVMGTEEAYGIRVCSDYMDRGLLPILIDGVTELARKPGDSLIYVWDMDPSSPKPTDEATLAKLRLPSRDIKSDDRETAALAKTITNGKDNDYEKARAIHQWVAGNIWYNIDWLNGVFDTTAVRRDGEETWTSTYVLRNKRGVCEGYATLTVALLRAVGIPAKNIGGYVESDGSGHAWVEAYADARWINMDPTWDSKNRYENGKFSPQQASGNQWFDVSDNEFSKGHRINNYAEYILANGLAATK